MMFVKVSILVALAALTAAQRPTGSHPTHPPHQTRPGGSSSCDGKCTTECATGEACIFSFDRATMQGACACGTAHGGGNFPGGGGHPQSTTTRIPRTIQPNMHTCDGWMQAGVDVSSEATCATICKDHRTAFDAFTPATTVDDATCCCKGVSPRAGDMPSVCCAVPDTPSPTVPSARDCTAVEMLHCGPATAAIVAQCASTFMTSMMQCDILAKPGTPAADACDASWKCALKNAGTDFKQCCPCIEQTAQMFSPDLDIPCEQVGIKVQ